ncbi:MAG: serine/threonine-protein kinase [Pirellulales bacterium]
MGRSSDRNLLFGVLAVQMDFLTRAQLFEGMQAWINDKATSLAEHVVRLRHMRPEQRDVLDALVDAHVRQHDDDPQRSLAALSSAAPIRRALERLDDTDVQASLGHVRREAVEVEPIDAPGGLGVDPNATVPPPSLGESTSRGTRFRIVRPHAEGGLGSVYVARDTELDREVALKEIQFDKANDPNNRTRFVREAEITGGLEHPGIVPVYGLGTYADGRPFYAMKFIRGDSLQDAIKRYHEPQDGVVRGVSEKNLELRRLLQRFIDVCEAIDYAHTRGVLHRDLKPGNIMLGRHGETLVVDWGLAKPLGKVPEVTAAERKTAPDQSTIEISRMPEAPLTPKSSSDGASEPTMQGNTLGTPAFMSPEQAHGRIDLLGPASDVFSLGATLYVLLTGTVPYRGADTLEVLTKAQKADYPRPRAIDKSIPRDLEAICVKAMAPAIGDRYKSAKALADDLECWLADEAVTAREAKISERLSRLTRKHRGAFMAGTAALLMVTIGSLGATVVVNQARQRESDALAKETAARENETAAKNEALAARNTALTAVQREEAAKTAAETAAANEKQRADETAAVLKFVEERIFAAARPLGENGGLGRNVKLADAIAEAVPYIEDGLKDQPLVEARLRRTLGKSYEIFGKSEKARPHFEKAFAILKDKLGADHAETLDAMNDLAGSYGSQSDSVEGVRLRQDMLRICREKYGPEALETIKAMMGAGNPSSMLDMLPVMAEVERICREKIRTNHPDKLKYLALKATICQITFREKEAKDALEEVVGACRDKYGPDHPETLKAISHLASVYSAQDRIADAIELHEEILRLKRAKPDANFVMLESEMKELAYYYEKLGRTQHALELRRKVVKQNVAIRGADHPLTILSISSLADYYEKHERLSDALMVSVELVRLCRANPDFDFENTLYYMNDLGERYFQLARFKEARELREEILKLRREKIGPDDFNTAVTMHQLAETYSVYGRHSEAIKLYEVAHDKGVDSDAYASYELSLARCVANAVDAKNPVEGLKVIDGELDWMDRIYGFEFIYTLRMSQVRCYALIANHEPEKGLAEYRKVMAALKNVDEKSINHADRIRSARINAALANAWKTDKPDVAQKHADEALDWIKKAVDNGYFNVTELEHIKDFDTLRDRTDFQQLVADMNAKLKKLNEPTPDGEAFFKELFKSRTDATEQPAPSPKVGDKTDPADKTLTPTVAP